MHNRPRPVVVIRDRAHASRRRLLLDADAMGFRSRARNEDGNLTANRDHEFYERSGFRRQYARPAERRKA
jgi:hypothetical protein